MSYPTVSHRWVGGRNLLRRRPFASLDNDDNSYPGYHNPGFGGMLFDFILGAD
jgi:hypothetical protein